MFKNFEEWLIEKGIASAAYGSKEAKEQAQLYKEYMAYVSNALKEAADGNISKEDMDTAITEALKDLGENQALKDLQTRLDEAEEKVNTLTEAQKGEGPKTTLVQAIKAQKEELTNMVKGITNKEIVLKADTLRTSIATNPSGYFLPDIGQLGVKKVGLYDILPKIPVPDGNHQGLIRYVDWDEATIARAAAVVAEGGAFPESTAAFKGYSKELVKVGDTLPVSMEFGQDEVTAAAELEAFLDTNVRSKRDADLINGAGTAGQIEGLLAAAPAYTPVASGIVAPNIYDLAKLVRTTITVPRGTKYNPDFVVMNSITADEFHLTKDANENYIFKDEGSLGSMIIVIDDNMADNVMVVGDRRYARIYEKSGVALSRGLVADQFVEDMETIKARIRLLMLIRNVDKTGFLKVTDIDAALVTIGT